MALARAAKTFCKSCARHNGLSTATGWELASRAEVSLWYLVRLCAQHLHRQSELLGQSFWVPAYACVSSEAHSSAHQGCHQPHLTRTMQQDSSSEASAAGPCAGILRGASVPTPANTSARHLVI